MISPAVHLNHARAALAHYEATQGEPGPPFEWIEESILAFHLWTRQFFLQPVLAEEARLRYQAFRERLPRPLADSIFHMTRPSTEEI